MAARARVEWVTLGAGRQADGVGENTIKAIHGPAVNVAVATAPTATETRPTAPAFGDNNSGHALVRCLDNPIVVAWGANPTASDTNGKRLQPGEEIAIWIAKDQRISFIEVT